jgi:hypothetical protein
VFEKERILQLHNQGHCTASICVRLAVPIEYVRQVVGAAEAVKALRYAKWLATPDGRKAAALAKREEALQLLAEANGALGKPNDPVGLERQTRQH